MGENDAGRVSRSDSRIWRAAVTAGASVALLAGGRVALPLLDDRSLRSFIGAGSLRALSPLALGMVPFITAFVIVEFVAAVTPRWRGLRDGSAQERGRITRAAWALALLLAALQAWSMVGYLGSVRGAFGEPILPSDLLPRLAVGVSLTAGVALSGALAELVSQRGLGNGFAVLLTVQLADSHARQAQRFFVQPAGSWSDASLLAVLAIAVVVPLVGVRLVREPRGVAHSFPVPTCSLVILQLPGGVVTAVAAVAEWVSRGKAGGPSGWLSNSTWSWVWVGIVVALAPPLSRLFFPRDAVEATWRRAARPPDGDQVADLRRALSRAHLRSLALVAALAALPLIAAELGAPQVPSQSFVIAAAMVFALAVDLFGEWKARADAAVMVPVRPLHRVYAVEPVLRALGAAGIEGFARTRHFRALFHFFAPYAAIEVLVAPARAEEADAIVARVIAGTNP